MLLSGILGELVAFYERESGIMGDFESFRRAVALFDGNWGVSALARKVEIQCLCAGVPEDRKVAFVCRGVSA